jgi:hypothetical protein
LISDYRTWSLDGTVEHLWTLVGFRELNVD